MLHLEDFKGVVNIPNDVYAIFDDNPLFLNLNTYQNVSYILDNHVSLCDVNELGKLIFDDISILRKKVRKLSLGQRKLIGLMIMILSKKNILLLMS